MKRLLFILPVVLFAGLAIFFAFGLRRDPSKIPSAFIDRPLPPLALAGLGPGESGFSSAAIRGEPALVNVFASWCLPCKVEHPLLMRLKQEGVAIYGVNWKDAPANGLKYLDDNGDPYRATGSDESGRGGIELGVTGVPETFVVDKNGRVRYKHVGPIMPQDWDETLKPLLDKLRVEA